MSHGQGKPQNGQGNVREKSGNFVRAHGWTPSGWPMLGNLCWHFHNLQLQARNRFLNLLMGFASKYYHICELTRVFMIVYTWRKRSILDRSILHRIVWMWLSQISLISDILMNNSEAIYVEEKKLGLIHRPKYRIAISKLWASSRNLKKKDIHDRTWWRHQMETFSAYYYCYCYYYYYYYYYYIVLYHHHHYHHWNHHYC